MRSVFLPRCLKPGEWQAAAAPIGDGDASTDTVVAAAAAAARTTVAVSLPPLQLDRSVSDLHMSWQPAGAAGDGSTSSQLAMPPAQVFAASGIDV